jgi:hypothetical protein
MAGRNEIVPDRSVRDGDVQAESAVDGKTVTVRVGDAKIDMTAEQALKVGSALGNLEEWVSD